MTEQSKGKYGALIQKARETENQESVKPDDQITSEPEKKEGTGKPKNQTTKKPDSQTSGKPKNQKTGKPDNQITSQPELETETEREVNLCVKVPESLRRHWAAESKRAGITMTEVIVKALEDRFGRPE
jgi:hypothetical protein